MVYHKSYFLTMVQNTLPMSLHAFQWNGILSIPLLAHTLHSQMALSKDPSKQLSVHSKRQRMQGKIPTLHFYFSTQYQVPMEYPQPCVYSIVIHEQHYHP